MYLQRYGTVQGNIKEHAEIQANRWVLPPFLGLVGEGKGTVIRTQRERKWYRVVHFQRVGDALLRCKEELGSKYSGPLPPTPSLQSLAG